MKKSTIELSDKERVIVWAIACWFDKPVTSTLKQKLYPGEPLRRDARKYDEAIEDRIISLGKWLENRRAEAETKPEKGTH